MPGFYTCGNCPKWFVDLLSKEQHAKRCKGKGVSIIALLRGLDNLAKRMGRDGKLVTGRPQNCRRPKQIAR